MLYTITLLTCLFFAFTYPLCFCISGRDPLKNNFHHFHLGLPVIVGILALYFVYQLDTLDIINYAAIGWGVAALTFTAYSWKKETASIWGVIFLSAWGLWITFYVHGQLIEFSLASFLISLLSSLIFTGSLYAMNLGHWYLNVHGLPIKHLRDASYVFWALVSARLIWNGIHIFLGKVFYQGEDIAIWQFMGRLDGFLLLVPIFFGTLLPFVAMFMVNEIIKLKNTQAATGILYVVLCGVLVGDIAYKFFLIKFGITL